MSGFARPLLPQRPVGALEIEPTGAASTIRRFAHDRSVLLRLSPRAPAHERHRTERATRRGPSAKRAPPLLLLHGFPQTHAMWHRVAPRLRERFALVAGPIFAATAIPTSPKGSVNHSTYSKRAMALDCVELMRGLGFDRFAVCGHDRGARVTHPARAGSSASGACRTSARHLADAHDVREHHDGFRARLLPHWFFLIQPAPLPERLIGADPVFYLRAKMGGWGSGGTSVFDPRALAEYERCFTPAAIHAMCEDYPPPAATIDLDHDRGRRPRHASSAQCACCGGERGVVHKLFTPLADWQAKCAGNVHGPAASYRATTLPRGSARHARR